MSLATAKSGAYRLDGENLVRPSRINNLLKDRRRTPVTLNTLFRLSATPQTAGATSDGVAVTAYGQGQLTGVTYTVPAHGEIEVDFEMDLLCVTPQDIDKLSALIRTLLDASHQHIYDDLQKTDISGGASFFGFFSFGASASYSETKHTMDSWGLSERNQEVIVDSMMQLAQKTNRFLYKGTVFNQDYDYDVTGNMFGIVMDASIQQGQASNQLRFLAPQPHLQNNDGTATLPSVGRLYS